jgi:hypothetical protein
MSEATVEAAAPEPVVDAEAAARAAEAERVADRARMRKIGGLHLVAVLSALTLWGAADAWAVASGWSLALAVSVANAAVAAHVIASIAHEWGHFAGARLSGARSPVLEKPANYFFMFDFPFDQTDTREFVWMSWGGIVAPWLLVVATVVLVPIDTLGRLTLLAAFAMSAARASFFEVPIVTRARQSGEPRAELGRELAAGGLASATRLAWGVGAVVWLGLWLLI